MADEQAVFAYVCQVCAGYRVNPLEIWERGTLEQLFLMASAGIKVRKKELLELLHVTHTSNPKAFADSLNGPVSRENAWIGLATALGDEKAVKKMRLNKMAAEFLEREQRARRSS